MMGFAIRMLKTLRNKYYRRVILRTAKSVAGPLTVNGLSYVNAKTELGSNVHFNGMRIIGKGSVRIGSNFHSGKDCVIICETHNYHGTALPYDGTYIERPVKIDDNVWLGHGVIVLGGVTIGEGAIIQAGAVVSKSIPPLGIAGGNPAVVFRQRDAQHYNALKAEGKFH